MLQIRDKSESDETYDYWHLYGSASESASTKILK